MLLVGRVFPQEANDPHWTATDPRKRAQVIHVRDRTKVKPIPLPEIDYSDVPGFSTADLIQIEKQSNSVVRKRNSKAFVSWGAPGYWGGASWAIYVVGKRFKIWVAIKALYITAREVVEATECASERWEEIAGYFEDLDWDVMALIAMGLFLDWGIVLKWPGQKKAFRRAVWGGFGLGFGLVGEGVRPCGCPDARLAGVVVQSQTELAKEIAQIEQGGGNHSPHTTNGSSGTEATLSSLDSPRIRSELSEQRDQLSLGSTQGARGHRQDRRGHQGKLERRPRRCRNPHGPDVLDRIAEFGRYFQGARAHPDHREGDPRPSRGSWITSRSIGTSTAGT
ncbi:unnamed protein product [Prorocentrum cordatum]|uniref:Uncharacterized protein n=1 Tax=Prorocentrum cordatum TaxID=2364126 RepID=A0ABN9PER6_9DINO|nr:unnamed protein product [Polarella glacialis]